MTPTPPTTHTHGPQWPPNDAPPQCPPNGPPLGLATYATDRLFASIASGQAIYTQSQAQFGSYVQAGTLLNNYAHVLDLLTRLRQAINHPYLVIHSKRGEEANAAAAGSAGASTVGLEGGGICGICYEDADDAVVTGCGHAFCRACMRDFVESLDPNAASLCPTCHQPLSVDLNAASTSAADKYHACHEGGEGEGSSGGDAGALGSGLGGGVAAAGRSKRGILSRLDLRHFQSSTKIEALMEELHLMNEGDPAAKAIVFSQYVAFLDLLEHRLMAAGIRVVKLNGGMAASAREAVLRLYKEDPAVTVILISLKAGGVALNLTVASHIYLMDPWWNPAAEYQAIDRAHRIGQHKPIRAVRFVVRNTVEERILRLQDKKRLVFEGTVGGDAAALGQLTEEDLHFLFQN